MIIRLLCLLLLNTADTSSVKQTNVLLFGNKLVNRYSVEADFYFYIEYTLNTKDTCYYFLGWHYPFNFIAFEVFSNMMKKKVFLFSPTPSQTMNTNWKFSFLISYSLVTTGYHQKSISSLNMSEILITHKNEVVYTNA